MIKPRIYQAQAIPFARKALRKDKRALVVLATALGKTLTSAMIWHGFKKGPGLFLVHTNGILNHAIKEYRKVYGTAAKLVLFKGDPEEMKGVDIVFSTFQMMGNHLRKFRNGHFGWMTVDETHHAQADSYRRVVEYFTCPRLGITATPDRADLRDIRKLFGDEVINISLEEAIANNWLPRIEYHVVLAEGFDDEALQRITVEVMEEGKRLSLQEINRRVFIRALDEKIAQRIEEYEEKALVFCRNITHANNFVSFLRDAETYHSDHSQRANEAVLDRLLEGSTRRVLSVNAFNEGIDVPDVGVIAFCRTTDSETIFRQQIGRGMRTGKEKLVVLDFVGNLERILMLKEMIDRIKGFRKELGGSSGGGRTEDEGPLHVSGAGFEFNFSSKVVDLMAVLERVKTEFYPTWQDASVAARQLHVSKKEEYARIYKQDERLPNSPRKVYKDFPGWSVFLGVDNRRSSGRRYLNWEAASSAAIRLGIANNRDYSKRYKEDRRLPGSPSSAYLNFPGWRIFLGGEKRYSTWKEASKAAKSLGIGSAKQYSVKYRRDPGLPATPNISYPDFPGWYVFLGKKDQSRRSGVRYPDWKSASKAAKKLGITSLNHYNKLYRRNPRLPSSPRSAYSDFPGWPTFLGKK